MKQIDFQVKPTAPFRLDLTVWVLRRRPDNQIDRWDGQTYRRLLVVDAMPVVVAVRQSAPADAPLLDVTVTGEHLPDETGTAVTTILDRLLGLQTDLTSFYRLAAADERLGPLASRFVGVRPPRLSSIHETLTNAIACQQVTLTLGIRLLNKLAERFGLCLPGEPGVALPRPEDLVAVDVDALRSLGFSGQKARALTELARTIVGGLDLSKLAALDDADVVASLTKLRGIGRWSAEYVLLRGLGRLHVFPGDDVGARNNLQRWLGLAEPLNYQGVQQVVARWQPYAGLVYFHLLLDRLATNGWIT